MSHKKSFDGRVSNSKLILKYGENALRESLPAYEGKEIVLTIEPKRKRRSDNQNRYYWAVIVKMLGDYFGYEGDEMHEALKMKFLVISGGEGRPDTIKGTSKLTTIEFNEYIDKVIRWASQEFGVVIPDPNQWQDVGYYEQQ